MVSESEEEYERLERREERTADHTEPDPAVGAVGLGFDRPVAPESEEARPGLWIEDEPDGTTGRTEPPATGTQVANPGMLAGYGSVGPPAAPPSTAAEATQEPEAEPFPGAAGPAGPADVVDVLVADHRSVNLLFDQLLDAVAVPPQRRRDLVDVAVAELMRHAAAEEQYLYPAVRRYLPGGDALADRELLEHGRAEELMHRLMHTDVDDPRFAPLVGQLAHEIRQHVREEEDELFPRLRQAVDRDTLVRLGTEVLGAKKVAPTRPHPAGPHHPPMNRVAAPVLGLFDRTVDSLTDRPTNLSDLDEPH